LATNAKRINLDIGKRAVATTEYYPHRCTLYSVEKGYPEVLSTLLMLGLKNIVQQHLGKLFTKSI